MLLQNTATQSSVGQPVRKPCWRQNMKHGLHTLQHLRGLIFQPVSAIIWIIVLLQASVNTWCINSIISFEYTLVLLSIQQLQKNTGQLIFDLEVNQMAKKKERNLEWMMWKQSWLLFLELFLYCGDVLQEDPQIGREVLLTQENWTKALGEAL